jgi:PKD repeat protein
MKLHQSLLLFLAMLLQPLPQNAQIPEGGIPYSSLVAGLKHTASIPKVTLKNMDIEQLLAEDAVKPVPLRYAVFEKLTRNMKTDGKPDLVPGLGKIWRLRFNSSQAKSMQLLFDTFIVPEGAKLFIYNENQTILRGAFTSKHMQPDSALVLADFPGGSVIVEYFEPEHAAFGGEVVIGHVSQAYRDILNELSSEDGFININCPEGKNAQLEKHAVCKITFRSEDVSYLCSGALINNARNDGTPYFLTAHHCLSKADEAASMMAYFNYENAGCDGEALLPVSLGGSTLLFTADSSDATLLQLWVTPPGAAQPYYAGWDARDVSTDKVYGIHHPLGLTKKYSYDRDSIFANPIEITWSSGSSVSPVGSHWILDYDLGVTEGGSSGSPLFNPDRQIIGQLHGGSSNVDIYGRFSYSYAHKPAGFPALQYYLDPDSTGILTLDGYTPEDNPPDAFFVIENQVVCLEAPVTLYNYSVFNPESVTWMISPETFIFTDGSTANSPQPSVAFTAPASYRVKLAVTNSAGWDTMTIQDAILAGDTLSVKVKQSPDPPICLCDFTQIQLEASGAEIYTWSIAAADTDKVELDTGMGDTVVVYPKDGYKPSQAYDFQVITISKQGACADTLWSTYGVLKPENDEIANAILLSYGKSILYSNICASIEPGEPVPPYSSCTGQLSWCDEYGTGEDIVENSVWFKFIAPASAQVRVWSTGMDNQIALYEADGEADILAGHYEIIGANDDRTSTDYHPSIRSVDVVPGKTYWIQVDGSGGGLEDVFYMHLYESAPTGMDDLQEERLQVYPQPASGVLYLKGDVFTDQNSIVLEVFTATGMLMLRETLVVQENLVSLDVSSWEPGIYLIRTGTGKDLLTARVIKK